MLLVGTEVRYQGMYGKIDFAIEDYAVMCVKTNADSCTKLRASNDVRIVLRPWNMNDIELVNGNR